MAVETRVIFCPFQRRKQCSDTGLRGHTGHAISCRIHSICPSLCTSNVCRDTGPSRVMTMYVDWEVRIFLADGSYQHRGSFRFEYSSHILDAKDVSANFYNLVNHVHVIIQIVLLLGIEHVSTVTYRCLDHTASSMHSFDADFELVDVIQCVKDTENVDSISLGLFTEMVNSVVWKSALTLTDVLATC
jgi:hypothetical protein